MMKPFLVVGLALLLVTDFAVAQAAVPVGPKKTLIQLYRAAAKRDQAEVAQLFAAGEVSRKFQASEEIDQLRFEKKWFFLFFERTSERDILSATGEAEGKAYTYDILGEEGGDFAERATLRRAALNCDRDGHCVISQLSDRLD